MSALLAAWQALEEAVRQDSPSPGLVDHATLALMQLAPFSTAEEVNALMERAAALIRTERLAAAAPVAMSCGALVEQGAAGDLLAEALMARLPEVFAQAWAYAEAVDELRKPTEGDEVDGDWVGDSFAPDDWIRERLQTHPDEVVAWHELRRFCLPAIAAATHDRVVLERFVRRDLGPYLDRLRHLDPNARFLYRLHRVLLDAPLRFIDLPSGRVFDLRIDGVATNFELHTLLLDALAEPLGLDPPDPAIVACLRGTGPRQLLEKSRSDWALYSHEAVPALLSGNRAPMQQWVWNEAIPAEIPELDGTRVVVATPASFAREWDSGRTFNALGGTVELVAELDPDRARAVVGPLA